MGAGGSVDKKATGKSKTLRVKDDATDLRPQSGPSYIAEVRVRDDASQCIDALFICNDWGSFKGGLPTFNREFAVNLAKAASDRINVHVQQQRRGPNDPMEWLKFPVSGRLAPKSISPQSVSPQSTVD